ncbi:Mov34/MPN/PAD-1 family protein [Muricauda sp. SCSIO 64092]|uniref:Mov34/MPN/PAD-1 family protein n=1 Tax=Allomuricauda sp. SCSIO 64092 TaxID=2908842 RepID=UPI001FF4EAB8|nr:Mov34/MPN/PAD-1 family protein [Muricauda sp. SCSIO 64092]UOY05011.1 Mov34/MPN/PAD-1 family protein [Muricauda sp. SCSIO 64092]
MKTRITTSAYNEMLKTVGSHKAEKGGLLFGSRKDWVVTKFLYDRDAKTTSGTYTFNVGYLNPMIEKLGNQGYELLGFAHSHPAFCKTLSAQDRQYFASQFKNIPVDKFLVPLMFPATDGTYDFIPYVFYKDGRVEQTELDILPDDYATYIVNNNNIVSEAPRYVSRSLFTFREYFMILLSVLSTGIVMLLLKALLYISRNLETILKLSP